MSLSFRLAEHVLERRVGAVGVVFGDAEAPGKRVGALKADAGEGSEPVRVGLDLGLRAEAEASDDLVREALETRTGQKQVQLSARRGPRPLTQECQRRALAESGDRAEDGDWVCVDQLEQMVWAIGIKQPVRSTAARRRCRNACSARLRRNGAGTARR